MQKIKIFQVDAFTDKLFKGNPAAVCPLESWMDATLMQSIAAENNLAETAFIVPKDKGFEIRWFTPMVEVDLCGHATLASAYVLFNCLNYIGDEIVFYSKESGVLKVSKQGNNLFLDFPTDNLYTCRETEMIKECIGIEPVEVWKGKTDYLALLKNEDEIRNLNPDLVEIAKLGARGLIVTAKGDEVDFVSRFFAPQSGVNEDPVTGSAHTSLIPFWYKKLNKKDFTAKQLSQRGGVLTCQYADDRCMIGGQAKLYMTGEINID